MKDKWPEINGNIDIGQGKNIIQQCLYQNEREMIKVFLPKFLSESRTSSRNEELDERPS